MIKNLIKSLATLLKIKCNNNIVVGAHDYIGLNVKIVNRGKMIFADNVIIRPSTGLYTHIDKSILEFGEGTEIGRDSTITSYNKVIFEKNVLTGPHVYIADHNHEYRNPDIPVKSGGVMVNDEDSVRIGEGSWLGTNVVVVGNVHIGKHCVIGANSVVTKDIPDYTVAAGIPCKVIKRYDFERKEWVRI